VYYTVDELPGVVVIPVGAFAEPTFPEPTFSVYDPGRTFSPCNNAGALLPTGNVNGAWSFKTLMTHMANGVPVQTFVNDWLRQWLAVATNVPHDDGVAVPSFPVPARPALLSAIQTL
jgi:hypothetical protein